jgi:hypothetical protein
MFTDDTAVAVTRLRDWVTGDCGCKASSLWLSYAQPGGAVLQAETRANSCVYAKRILAVFCGYNTAAGFIASPYYILFRSLDKFTYLLTPLSRVLLEKLTCSQLVKKFPAFYGSRKFITAFTISRHLSLSWASSIQSIHPHPTSWRSTLILSAWFFQVASFPQVSPPKPCIPSSLHNTC